MFWMKQQMFVWPLTNPSIPFSLCKQTLTSGGMKLLASMGIPIPRFAEHNVKVYYI